MKNRAIYDAALRLIAESTVPEETEDYEERAPYLLAAFVNECREVNGFSHAAHGKEAEEQERRDLSLKQRKELEEQRKRQEREKMKAEILAELKEAGIIAKETKKPKAAGGK